MRAVLQDMGLAIAHPSQPGAMKFATSAAWKAAGVLAPMLIGMMLIAIVVGFGQVGLKPSMKKLKPDFGRLNVIKGDQAHVRHAGVVGADQVDPEDRGAGRDRLAGRDPRGRELLAEPRTVRSGASRRSARPPR